MGYTSSGKTLQEQARSDDNNQKEPESSKSKKGYKRLVMWAGWASVATAITLIAIKLIVWLFSGSAAILASLTDSMIDCGASLINLIALRVALLPADSNHRYGHFKAEALASLTQAAFICGSAVLLIINGYDRIIKPQPVAYIDIAIYVSLVSIVLTVILTTFQGYVCKQTDSEAVAADRFHYLSDVGLNLSVILSLFLSKFYEWADGLMAMLLGLYILMSSWHIARTAIGTLLDRAMTPKENARIMQAILQVKEIKSCHDLRTRQAGPQRYVQGHIVIDGNITLAHAHELASMAEKNILKIFPETDITLHMEPDNRNITYKDIVFFDDLACKLPKTFYSDIQEGKSGSKDNNSLIPGATIFVSGEQEQK